jgi:hypothetical protein
LPDLTIEATQQARAVAVIPRHHRKRAGGGRHRGCLMRWSWPCAGVASGGDGLESMKRPESGQVRWRVGAIRHGCPALAQDPELRNGMRAARQAIAVDVAAGPAHRRTYSPHLCEESAGHPMCDAGRRVGADDGGPSPCAAFTCAGGSSVETPDVGTAEAATGLDPSQLWIALRDGFVRSNRWLDGRDRGLLRTRAARRPGR